MQQDHEAELDLDLCFPSLTLLPSYATIGLDHQRRRNALPLCRSSMTASPYVLPERNADIVEITSGSKPGTISVCVKQRMGRRNQKQHWTIDVQQVAREGVHCFAQRWRPKLYLITVNPWLQTEADYLVHAICSLCVTAQLRLGWYFLLEQCDDGAVQTLPQWRHALQTDGVAQRTVPGDGRSPLQRSCLWAYPVCLFLDLDRLHVFIRRGPTTFRLP